MTKSSLNLNNNNNSSNLNTEIRQMSNPIPINLNQNQAISHSLNSTQFINSGVIGNTSLSQQTSSQNQWQNRFDLDKHQFDPGINIMEQCISHNSISPVSVASYSLSPSHIVNNYGLNQTTFYPQQTINMDFGSAQLQTSAILSSNNQQDLQLQIELESLLGNTSLSDSSANTNLIENNLSLNTSSNSSNSSSNQTDLNEDELNHVSNQINPMSLFNSNSINMIKQNRKPSQQHRNNINKIDEELDTDLNFITQPVHYPSTHHTRHFNPQIAVSLPSQSFLNTIDFNSLNETNQHNENQRSDPVLTQFVLNSSQQNVQQQNAPPEPNLISPPINYYNSNMYSNQPNQHIYSSSLPSNYFQSIKRSNSPLGLDIKTPPSKRPSSSNLSYINQESVKIKSELLDPLLMNNNNNNNNINNINNTNNNTNKEEENDDFSKFSKLKLSSPLNTNSSVHESESFSPINTNNQNSNNLDAFNTCLFDIDDSNHNNQHNINNNNNNNQKLDNLDLLFQSTHDFKSEQNFVYDENDLIGMNTANLVNNNSTGNYEEEEEEEEDDDEDDDDDELDDEDDYDDDEDEEEESTGDEDLSLLNSGAKPINKSKRSKKLVYVGSVGSALKQRKKNLKQQLNLNKNMFNSNAQFQQIFSSPQSNFDMNSSQSMLSTSLPPLNGQFESMFNKNLFQSQPQHPNLNKLLNNQNLTSSNIKSILNKKTKAKQQQKLKEEELKIGKMKKIENDNLMQLLNEDEFNNNEEDYQEEEDLEDDILTDSELNTKNIVKMEQSDFESGDSNLQSKQQTVFNQKGKNSSRINSESLFDLMMSSKNRDSYFWQYNIQSKGPKTKKVLTLRNKDPHLHRDFYDPVFQLQSLNSRAGTSLNKLRKGDGNDVTPNADKLYNLGIQIRDFIQKSYQMNSACFTPNSQQMSSSFGNTSVLSASLENSQQQQPERVNLKREKNKIASRACRLKKKAQHEANKIKLFGLNEEHKQFIDCINSARELIRKRLTNPNQIPSDKKMLELIDDLIKQKIRTRVAGNSDGYVHSLMLAIEKQRSLNNNTKLGKNSNLIDLNQFNAQYNSNLITNESSSSFNDSFQQF